MAEYAIQFEVLQDICGYKITANDDEINGYACNKLIDLLWTPELWQSTNMKDIECCEDMCPVVKKLDVILQ